MKEYVCNDKEKTCKGKCAQTKPLSAFYKDKAGRSGRKAICKECKPLINRPNRIQDVETQKRYRTKIRRIVIKEYGGKCNCCGESEFDFLCIDHINNDGAEHRKQLVSGKTDCGSMNIYLFLIRNNFPKDNFQILCYNCNMSKSKNGQCVHKLLNKHNRI